MCSGRLYSTRGSSTWFLPIFFLLSGGILPLLLLLGGGQPGAEAEVVGGEGRCPRPDEIAPCQCRTRGPSIQVR